jgi:hypothetical protein
MSEPSTTRRTTVLFVLYEISAWAAWVTTAAVILATTAVAAPRPTVAEAAAATAAAVVSPTTTIVVITTTTTRRVGINTALRSAEISPSRHILYLTFSDPQMRNDEHVSFLRIFMFIFMTGIVFTANIKNTVLNPLPHGVLATFSLTAGGPIGPPKKDDINREKTILMTLLRTYRISAVRREGLHYAHPPSEPAL